MPNVFLIGDTSNRYNWGCRATTFQLRRMIEEVGNLTHALDTSFLHDAIAARTRTQKQKPTDNSVSASSSPREVLKGHLRKILYAADPTLVARMPALARMISPAELPKLARAIRQGKLYPNIGAAMTASDVVLINGEGSLMQNRGVGKFKMLFAYTAKVEFGKPTAIVNHTADFRNPAMQQLAAAVYPVLDDTLFRESFSLKSGESLRGGKTFDFAADAAFMYKPQAIASTEAAHIVSAGETYDPSDLSAFNPAAPYICVGGSSEFRGHEGQFRSYRESFRDLCLRLQRIAPVVVTASSAPDHDILRPVAEELKLPYLGLSTDVQQAVDILGRAAAYVGGRWHPGILALTGGTPVVSFSANSDYKSRGLVNLAGLTQPEIRADSVQSNLDTIVETTRSYVAQGDALRDQLKARVAALSDTCRRNVRLVQEVADA